MNHEALIKEVRAREILDSRGEWTLEAVVELRDGALGVAGAPGGRSKGVHEAAALPAVEAVKNVNGPIAKTLKGMDPANTRAIDWKLIELDGTEHKSKLGANATVAVSIACAKAAAAAHYVPLYKFLRKSLGFDIQSWLLPVGLFNVINGGSHVSWNLDITEFFVIPDAPSFHERLKGAVAVYEALGRRIVKMGGTRSIGDEGGYAPTLPKNEDALVLIVETAKEAGVTAHVGMDAASSGFYYADEKRYVWKHESRRMGAKDLLAWYQSIIKKYPITVLEDPFAEDDWEAWEMATATLGKTATIVGDDLFVTNTKRIAEGVRRGVANAVLIKPNQIGTLSETADAIKLAARHGYKIVVSHRSGETNDDAIADLAVAVGADFVKFGAPARGERVAKYNRLLAIENEL